MNNHTISGNLGRDAELRRTQNGTAVLSFSLPMKSGFGEREKTDWVKCAVFGKRAEGRLAEFLKKGTPVVVCGETYLDSYEKDGVEKISLAMNVSEVTLMGKKETGPTGAPEAPPAGSGGGIGSDLDDPTGIPF